ncbi:MAG TPA: 2-C-methyl-D-erythritol 4-phosphate cytidylyltransferase, partial [Chthoniobacterales bacterium]|nr:2-C-methyl-D-erythritol 4-phosphate cytidylyltransferase [Chthoniobacterales bacterium]
FAMQTPQVFARELLVDAYEALAAKSISVTDEVSAVQHLGRKVVLVPNQDFNFKITYPRDFLIVEMIFRQRKNSS